MLETLVGGHVSVSGGILLGVERAAQIGGNCMQFFAGSPRSWSRSLYSSEEVASFSQMRERFKIRNVFIHALYLINLASDRNEITEKSMEALKIDLLNCELLHGNGVIVHIGSHQGRGFESVKKVLVDRFSRLLAGTSTACIILENSAMQKGKIGSLDELAWIVGQLKNPRIKICLDTAHLFAGGIRFDDEVQMEILVEKLQVLGLLSCLACIHLNDLKSEFDSRRDIHANLGAGTIGIESLGRFVDHKALSGLPFILEVPGDPLTKQKGPDRENVDRAKKLFSSK